MYKEIVAGKKISSIFLIIVMLTTFIVVSDVLVNLQIGGYVIGTYLTYALLVLAFIFIIRQVNKCNTKYKYFIIADELIIYKVKGSKEEVMESIKVKNIKCIKNISKVNLVLGYLLSNKYFCFNLINNLYECRYDKQGEIRKFYFQPSYKLIGKLKITKNKYKF